MKDIDINLALIGRLLRQRWPVLGLLAVLGGLLGVAASPFVSPGYESSCKLLLPDSLSKGGQLAQAQIAMSLVVLDRTAQGLQWGDTGADLRGRITVSVEDGGVLQIVGTASTPDRAQQLTDRATQEYVTFSTQITDDANAARAAVAERSRERAQQKIDDAQGKVDQLQASPAPSDQGADGAKARDALAGARETLKAAQGELAALEVKQQQTSDQQGAGPSVRIIEPPLLPRSAAPPTLPELMAGGALVLVLLGVLGHLIAVRSDRRLHSQSEIAVAAGAPLLGLVEVVEQQHPRGRFALHDDRRWVESDVRSVDDERARASRYRRVLSRIRTQGDRRVVQVLVPRDDASARSAVLDMAVALAQTGRRVAVDTDDAAYGSRVVRVADRLGLSELLTVGSAGPGTHTVLGLVPVDVRRPFVPPAQAGSATLLTVTMGTRTSAELAEIALAAVESGRPIHGVVVVAAGAPGPSARPGANSVMAGAR